MLEGFERRSFERAKAQGRKKAAKAPKRSDFWALAAHHLVTVSLVATSYYMNFTRIGHIVIILLDVADILLPLAKVSKYNHVTAETSSSLGSLTLEARRVTN